jgi:small subunit ribosomal protein S17e
MGRICPNYVKRAARQLLERYPDRFSSDYTQNNKVLKEVADIVGHSLRNKIAGYLATLMKQKQKKETAEPLSPA